MASRVPTPTTPVAPRDVLLRPTRLRALLRGERVTVVLVTTGFFQTVVDAVPDCFGSVRTVLFGGEQHRPDVLRTLLRTAPPGCLLNVYGPTENSTISTCHQIDPGELTDGPAPIGTAVAGTEAHVLSLTLQPVAVGAIGELYLGGPGLAQSYAGDRARTAADPFSGTGARLYRTGDMVRLRPDGALDFLGRLDDQVKVRGHRLETGQVELTLRACSGVRDGVVLVQENTDGCDLVAVVVGDVDSDDVREQLTDCLPPYMVPARCVVVDRLPLTPSGKVDRRRLLAETAGPAGRSGTAAHRDAADRAWADRVETVVESIWQEVLGPVEVASHSDFFQQGGQSIKALRLVAGVQERLGVDLDVAVVFRERTVARIAAEVAALAAARGGSAL